MKHVQHYIVYGKEGELLVEGTIDECTKRLGVGKNSFRWYVTHPETQDRYRIVVSSPRAEKDLSRGELQALIDRWDAFVTPIREAYGVPKYKVEDSDK